VNDTLKLDFDNSERFEWHHYAFHVSDEEFDAIYGRVKGAASSMGARPGPAKICRLTTGTAGAGCIL